MKNTNRWNAVCGESRMHGVESVSYTHLDVYKRQDYDTLYSHVLRKIRECARAALMDGEAVADRLTNTCDCLLYTSSNRMTSLCGICFPGDVAPWLLAGMWRNPDRNERTKGSDTPLLSLIHIWIEQIVNNINSEVRKPPENKGMNVPNIACNP